MDHRFVEKWLTSEEIFASGIEGVFSGEREGWESIRDHLEQCEACRGFYKSLLDVHRLLLKEPATVEPPRGFTLRWKERLSQERHDREKIQFWGMFSLSTSGMLLVLSALIYLVGMTFETPSDWFMTINFQLKNLFICISALFTLVSSLVELVPFSIRLGLMFGVLSSILAAGLWWLNHLQRVYISRTSYSQ